MNKKKIISIIIPTYYSSEVILRCLESLKSQTYKNFEVIIVDGHSNDHIEKIIKNINNIKLKFIDMGKNVGFSKLSNFGRKFSEGDYLFFLNPDTELINKNTLSELMEKLKENPTFGTIGPIQIQHHSDPYLVKWIYSIPKFGLFKFLPINQYVRNFSKVFSRVKDKHNILYVDYVPGCALLIKKSIFDSIGGFNETFFLYFEDTDLCLKLWKKGYTPVLLKNLYIFHQSGHTDKFVSSDLKLFHFWRSKTIFYRIWGMAAIPLQIAILLTDSLSYLLLGNKLKSIFGAVFGFFYGLFNLNDYKPINKLLN